MKPAVLALAALAAVLSIAGVVAFGNSKPRNEAVVLSRRTPAPPVTSTEPTISPAAVAPELAPAAVEPAAPEPAAPEPAAVEPAPEELASVEPQAPEVAVAIEPAPIVDLAPAVEVAPAVEPEPIETLAPEPAPIVETPAPFEPEPRASLEVVVEFASGDDPTCWTLSAEGVEPLAPVRLDFEGRATFESLAAGRYVFALTRDDGASAVVEQLLEAGGDWTLTLRVR